MIGSWNCHIVVVRLPNCVIILFNYNLADSLELKYSNLCTNHILENYNCYDYNL